MTAPTFTGTPKAAPRRPLIHLSVPHMSGRELPFVLEAFDTNWLSTVGPNLQGLEAEFTRLVGMPSVALSSGTAAIHLGLRLLGLRPDDEVVAPTLTFAATCNPILYEGAKPVLIDSERRSWNMDPDLLDGFLERRARLNRLPKAVIVVHLYGQSADLDPILNVCRRYEVSVLEDAAESLGADYRGRPTGTFGDVGVYSFNGNKIITATGGGMLVSPRAEWIEKIRHWSTQARDPDPEGVNNYVHSELGYNYRLSNVLAGIARGQLGALPHRVAERRAVASRYREGLGDLPGLEMMPTAPYGTPTNWLSCLLVDEEAFGMSAPNLIRFLATCGIESRPVWKPMHTQALYSRFEQVGGGVAEDLNRRGICLPSSSSLPLDDQSFVISCIHEAHRLAAKI